MKVGRTFHFDAAHFLPEYKGKCERLHGHTYRLDVEVDGEPGENGMVLDFNELKKTVKETVLDSLDHADLNKIFPEPTAEHIAEWIYSQLSGKISVCSVTLWEGEGKWVRVER